MATLFGLNLVFKVKPNIWLDCGLLFIFYGLYYGVLGRDISEICADKMASHIGVCIFYFLFTYFFLKNMFSSIIHPKVCLQEI